jgi:hypothetical protein
MPRAVATVLVGEAFGMSWAQVLLGWPAILGSLAVSISGVILRRARLLVIGAVLVSGFAWLYLPAWPMFRGVAYVIPLLHLAGAYAVDHKQGWLAGLCLVPHAFVAMYLGGMVLSQ